MIINTFKFMNALAAFDDNVDFENSLGNIA